MRRTESTEIILLFLRGSRKINAFIINVFKAFSFTDEIPLSGVTVKKNSN